MRASNDHRIRAARVALRERGAAALALTPGANTAYLVDYAADAGERHAFLFVPAEGDPVLVVPELDGARARADAAVADVRTWGDADDPLAVVDDALADCGVAGGEVLLDPEMAARFVLDLQTLRPDCTFGLADAVLGPLRARKDDAEIDALRRAGRAADRAMRDVREWGDDVVGDTERELARRIETRLDAHGGTGTAFPTIVASGPNAANPHHEPGERIIEAGDPVTLDFGTLMDGYPSDQTRTVVFAGDPPEGYAAAHEAVVAAQRAAVDAVEPGVPAGEVDAAARDVIAAAGYGDAFLHRTGHGVGLDVHEPPTIVAGNETPLEAGMVFSVEPGIYVEDAWGVRIEDLVVVTESGCERLNDTPRGWRI
ncbi:Xaa-Pro aminopeptidase [Halarchaeum rubridurum]|uniref:Peptidase n=1 Tax=Halarchaeum rubridurum TaxID=489911 RepID=A0A830G305_9EURY|nr:Xaa-Pro peptidase family protein [Halarchaeum rubridurum]MBP1955480.1 Xaa-Pro aminopeptidase [Halarchaeum rubridurum]GGM72707.1 peptidase [Halarchaeum rubridurum]